MQDLQFPYKPWEGKILPSNPNEGDCWTAGFVPEEAPSPFILPWLTTTEALPSSRFNRVCERVFCAPFRARSHCVSLLESALSRTSSPSQLNSVWCSTTLLREHPSKARQRLLFLKQSPLHCSETKWFSVPAKRLRACLLSYGRKLKLLKYGRFRFGLSLRRHTVPARRYPRRSGLCFVFSI